MLDVEIAGCRHEAVLAGIEGAQPDDIAHILILGVVYVASLKNGDTSPEAVRKGGWH
jgi:hypothetical protein